MMTITQNKVAGFEPRWAPFPGFSLLFDSPGSATSRAESLEKVMCVPEAGGELDLYHGLSKTIAEIGRDAMITSFLFCPLPPSSYHVTVWDGVNADNECRLHQELRREWSAFLRGVPNPLHRCPPTMRVVTESSLANGRSGAIIFRFEQLTIWGDQVLVARLAPADERSAGGLKILSEARAVLGREAKQQLGIDTPSSYSPHVSLGYFANREHGRLAHSHVGEWTDRFRKNLASSSIVFTSLDVYAFTDMVSFWKKAVPSRRRPHAPDGARV